MKYRLVLLAALLCFPVCVSAGPVYDVVADFSIASNPNGVWSYGYATTLNPSNFAPHTNSTTNYFGDGLAQGFYTPVSAPATDLPTVLQNISGGNLVEGTIHYWPADMLLMHPGSADQYSVVRFTAPAAGEYRIAGSFTGMDIGRAGEGTTTDTHVLHIYTSSSSSLFSGPVSGYQVDSFFDVFTELDLGESIDFAVGYGSNGNYYYDSTGLRASVTPVPEPGSLLLLGSGLIGAAGFIRRRMRS